MKFMLNDSSNEMLQTLPCFWNIKSQLAKTYRAFHQSLFLKKVLQLGNVVMGFIKEQKYNFFRFIQKNTLMSIVSKG